MNPEHSAWVLRYLTLRTPIGLVVPPDQARAVREAIAAQHKRARKAMQSLGERFGKPEQKRLKAWAKELCGKLDVSDWKRTQIRRKLSTSLVERAGEAWHPMSRRLAIRLVMHLVPDFKDEVAMLHLRNDLVIALLGLVGSLSGDRRVKTKETRLKRVDQLRALNRTAQSRRVDQFLNRLREAGDKRRAQLVTDVRSYELRRRSWLASSPSELRRGLEGDRLPIP